MSPELIPEEARPLWDDWSALGARLMAALKPVAPPVAITFTSGRSSAPARLDEGYPSPNAAGRTGQVPAGCVYWIRGAEREFATVAADHANCSVGSYTHGFLTLEEAAGKDDVRAVLDAGWVDPASVASLPRVKERPEAVVYGPATEATEVPDVVLVRIQALGLMTLSSALPELRIEGKPQCHIIAIAKEENVVAASVGCALSRARTGMKATEMTCAIPGRRLREVVEALERTVTLDRSMARYAAADATRFLSPPGA